MEKNIRSVTIIVKDRLKAFEDVSYILHQMGKDIMLRVGYPMPDKNASIIFLVLNLSNDELGAFTGKLGQIKSVSVKSASLKL